VVTEFIILNGSQFLTHFLTKIIESQFPTILFKSWDDNGNLYKILYNWESNLDEGGHNGSYLFADYFYALQKDSPLLKYEMISRKI